MNAVSPLLLALQIVQWQTFFVLFSALLIRVNVTGDDAYSQAVFGVLLVIVNATGPIIATSISVIRAIPWDRIPFFQKIFGGCATRVVPEGVQKLLPGGLSRRIFPEIQGQVAAATVVVADVAGGVSLQTGGAAELPPSTESFTQLNALVAPGTGADQALV
jgi:hypothetical protein